MDQDQEVNGKMKFAELALKRRSVRKFKEDTVEKS